MSRLIQISVLIGYVFVGFEGLTDAARPVLDIDRDHSHEVHSQIHVDNHEHHGDGKHNNNEQGDDEHDDSEHDDHFCHCSVHAAVLLSLTATPAAIASQVTSVRFDSRFTSRAGPPLLRPPNT